jgi:alpha-glucosidase
VGWTIENHDTNRAVTRYGGGETGRRRALAMTTMLMGLGGLPFLYQGQELGNENGTVEPGALADPISVRNPGATSGRDGARTAMGWDNSPHNGFSVADAVWLPSSPRPAEDTVAGQTGVPGSWLEEHRRLIAVRRQHPDLAGADFSWLDADNGLLMALRRGSMVVACNLDEYPGALTLPEGTWRTVFSSRGDEGGPVGAVVAVQAETALILASV